MEETAAWTRTGRNGVNRVPGDGFVAAGFRHRTSRDRDPLLHTHVLVTNSVRAGDGRWRTIDSKGLYDHARTAGFVYQVELRHHLSDRLGVTWGHIYQGTADIAGVDPALIDLFSKRRAAIEAELAEWGLSSAAAAQVATLNTREVKSDAQESEAVQRARWRTEAAAAGHVLGMAEVLESGGSSAAPSDAEEPVSKTRVVADSRSAGAACRISGWRTTSCPRIVISSSCCGRTWRTGCRKTIWCGS